MGSNNNNSGGQPNQPGSSSMSDPRGRLQNQSAYQQQRYENQQGPMVNQMAANYGQGSTEDMGNYNDIMNMYRGIASGAGSSSGGGGGYGGPGYTPFLVSPGRASYSDPFQSYAGYQDFSKTGGYSADDIANMRARGVSPIRAAYANATQEMGRQRSLQGGYSPNAAASLVKMAREQGQGGADATQNVEAGLAQARNTGKLAGLGGMSNIEGQRLNADVDLSKFNTNLDYTGQVYNADARARAQAGNIGIGQSNAAAGANAAATSRAQQLQALGGMTSLYGATPGQSQLFGNQLLQGVGGGGTFGLGLMGQDYNSQTLPGQYDQTMGRVTQGVDLAGRVANPILDYYSQQRNQNQQAPTVGNRTTLPANQYGG